MFDWINAMSKENILNIDRRIPDLQVNNVVYDTRDTVIVTDFYYWYKTKLLFVFYKFCMENYIICFEIQIILN